MAYKLKVAPVNSNNFLRWYPNVTPTVQNSTLNSGLHNGYSYKWRPQPDLIPVLVGDTLTMYTNFDNTTYLAGKNVKVVEESSCGVYTVIEDVTKYAITATARGLNNAKIVLTIPVTNTDNNKKIRLAIAGTAISENYVKSTKIAESIVGDIRKTITLASGKLLAIGDFTVVGQAYNHAVVFNIDGTIDTTYDFGVGFDDALMDAVEQSDGKIVFIGFFLNYKGTAVPQMARVNADGSLDATLVSGIASNSFVYLLEIDGLGNIYIGGSGFIYGTSGTFERLYKTDSVGNREVAYTPSIPTSLGALKIQADNKLLLGLLGQNGVRRINLDGTTDGTFTSTLSGVAEVNGIDLDASGNIYVSGANLKLTNQLFAKLASTGTQDNAFLTLLGTGASRIYVNGTTVTIVSSGTVRDLDLVGALITDYNLSGTTITNFNTLGSIKFVTGNSVSYNGGTASNAFSLELEVIADITYVSNYFLVGQLTTKNINNTHLISFYSKSNIYNYDWAGFDELVDAFYQIRVSSSIVGISYPSEKEIYTEATTGKPRVTRAVNNKSYNFEIYYNVEELHDAVSTVSNFRYFGINGKQYIVEEYEVEFVRNLNIWKGVMTIKDVAFDRRINTCVT